MATQNDHAKKAFPSSTGCTIAATGLFTSSAAAFGSALGDHPYIHLLIVISVVLFAFGTAMVVTAFRERKRERDTLETLD